MLFSYELKPSNLYGKIPNLPQYSKKVMSNSNYY